MDKYVLYFGQIHEKLRTGGSKGICIPNPPSCVRIESLGILHQANNMMDLVIFLKTLVKKCVFVIFRLCPGFLRSFGKLMKFFVSAICLSSERDQGVIGFVSGNHGVADWCEHCIYIGFGVDNNCPDLHPCEPGGRPQGVFDIFIVQWCKLCLYFNLANI